jgi:hypothetical protein
MDYRYNATLNKYFKGDEEITKDKYLLGVNNVKMAFSYALKIHNGEAAEVPTELKGLIEAQLIALSENIPSEPMEEDYAEAGKILMGVSE